MGHPVQFNNFIEAALEEAQGPLQVVQGGADGGVGAVPGGGARPAAGRPRPGVQFNRHLRTALTIALTHSQTTHP